MNDRIARGISWGAALLCAHYIVWGCYLFQRQTPVLAQLFAGVGAELPASTKLIIGIANFSIWPAGTLLALLVIGKEFTLNNSVTRLTITFIILLAAAWFFDFAVSAMIEPLMDLTRKVG